MLKIIIFLGFCLIVEENKVCIENYPLKENELKIDLYPKNKPRNTFKKEPLERLLREGAIVYSFNKNKKLGFINSNVPVLNGFYQAHINHYPIRIKPDDIWLLIVQAFSHHVNENSEELRKYFVHFYRKKRLELTIFKSIQNMNKIDFELFAEQINEQMKVYLGKEIIENLTPNFTTTDYDSKMICKLSIIF